MSFFKTSLSRRQFALGASGLVLSLGGMGCSTSASAIAAVANERSPSRKLSILIMGGTHFVGPAVVREALARNHEVTIFNRGITAPTLFPGVERLVGNRYPEKDLGLRALEGSRKWDVVIDIPAYYPRLVEASARLLAARATHYIVMSSISVYADFKRVGLTEAAEVRPLPTQFPENETLIEDDWRTYGGRKAACERAAAAFFPDSWAAVRASGIIGGRADANAMYWPARMARGGNVIAPGDGTDPYQSVDVGDVARLLLMIAERKLTGAFNATGPAADTTFSDYLQACMQVTDSFPEVRWLPKEQMEKFEVTPTETPQWAPSWRVPGFARISSARARNEGWTTRQLADSVASNWLYFRENYRSTFNFSEIPTGFSPDRERAILAALSSKAATL